MSENQDFENAILERTTKDLYWAVCYGFSLKKPLNRHFPKGGSGSNTF